MTLYYYSNLEEMLDFNKFEYLLRRSSSFIYTGRTDLAYVYSCKSYPHILLFLVEVVCV